MEYSFFFYSVMKSVKRTLFAPGDAYTSISSAAGCGMNVFFNVDIPSQASQTSSLVSLSQKTSVKPLLIKEKSTNGQSDAV
jgi:hypothetical protein